MCSVSPFCDFTLQSLTRFLTPMFNFSSAANDTVHWARTISERLRDTTSLYIFKRLGLWSVLLYFFIEFKFIIEGSCARLPDCLRIWDTPVRGLQEVLSQVCVPSYRLSLSWFYDFYPKQLGSCKYKVIVNLPWLIQQSGFEPLY